MPVQQFQEKGLPTVNTAVFGEGAVGKTALVHNFLYARRADWGYLPTMEDNKYSCLARLVAKEYIWKIVDTAGQEEYRRAMGDKWMRTGESFIAVFSLMRFDSLVGVQQLITLIHRMKGTNAVPLVLVGTKSDCASKRDARLTDQVIQSYADGLHIPYFEVSAETGEGIAEAFFALLEVAVKFSQPQKPYASIHTAANISSTKKKKKAEKKKNKKNKEKGEKKEKKKKDSAS